MLIAALLLFWIQPLYTKMALPYFGGAPAVWTTASMFFQFALLAGYLYAPSSLMLGVTQHITSEIAAVPLLWLAPLALYVITFINAFARRPPVKLEWTARLQPPLVISCLRRLAPAAASGKLRSSGSAPARCVLPRAGREWTFFEIDPVVIELALDRRWFTFLTECAPGASIIAGDGRLSLQAMPDGRFDLVIADAFSSDAIPVHMITREAIALYFRKLSERGVLLLQITNQYLDLSPVLAATAADLGLVAMVPGFRLSLASDARFAQMESHGMALARAPTDLAALATQEGWQPPGLGRGGRPWTDDYSNILQALK